MRVVDTSSKSQFAAPASLHNAALGRALGALDPAVSAFPGICEVSAGQHTIRYQRLWGPLTRRTPRPDQQFDSDAGRCARRRRGPIEKCLQAPPAGPPFPSLAHCQAGVSAGAGVGVGACAGAGAMCGCVSALGPLAATLNSHNLALTVSQLSSSAVVAS